jgi:hypothetical protein
MNPQAIHAFALLAALAVTDSSGGPVRGNGVSASEDREVKKFEKIDASGQYRLEISRSSRFRLTVSGDENIVPLIDTTFSGGTLLISESEQIRPKRPLVVTVALPVLESVSSTGAISAHIGSFKGTTLSLSANGAVALTADRLRYTSLSADALGSSSLQLCGTSERLSLRLQGASQVRAESFTAGTADLDVSGASRVTLGACGTLTGRADGVSSVDYYGTPESARLFNVFFTSSLRFLSR